MFCPKCGKELSNIAKFCSGCGEKMPESASVDFNESVGVGTDEASVSVDSEATVSVAVSETAENVSDNAASMKSVFSENTIPMNGAPEIPESGVSGSDAIASSVVTVSENENADKGNSVKANGFKFTKKTIIGTVAAVAGVAVVGVGASAFTFAKADFAHLFMGNKKYSAYVLTQQTEKVSQLSVFSSGVSIDTDESDYATVVAAALKDAIPEQGLEIEVSGSLNLKDDSLKNFARNFDCDTEQAEQILKAIKDCSAKAGVKFTDDGITANASLIEEGSDLFKAIVYYDAESEAYYLTMPGLIDESVMYASDNMIIDMDALSSDSKEDNEAAQMLTDVINAYKDSLDDAEITFEKGTFSIGDVEFEGRINTVTFSGDALADLVENVGEEFVDSDFAESYDIDFDVDDLVEEIEECKSAQLVIQNFVNGDNTSAGMNIELTVKAENGKKGTAQLGYLNCKDGMACIYDVSDVATFVLSQDKETRNSGKYTIKYSDGYDDQKFTISYENARTKKMFGRDIQLGEYSMKIPDSSEKINVALSDEDNKLNCTVTYKNDDGSYTVTVKLAEGFSDEFDTTTIDNAIDCEDSDATSGLELKLIQNLADKSKESKICNAIPYEGGTLADYFSNEAEKAQREIELKKNYSDYGESTARNARNMANQIYADSRNVGYSLNSQSEVKIKLYFDANGNVSVIDDGGVAQASALADKVSSYSYKNAYAEIVLWKGRGPVVGVNVVMTDDKNNVPDNLPTAYNFLDRAYNWGSDDDVNFVGSFVVGAYPTLSNEEGGTAKETDEKKKATIKTYSDEAKKAADALSEYTGLTFKDGNNFLNFSVSNGKWSYRLSASTLNGTKTDLETYMNNNVGAVTAKYVCIYFKNGRVVGATASDGSVYSNFAVEDFESGCTQMWSYMNGVMSSGYTVGAYPSLELMTELPTAFENLMLGTWTSRNGDKIDITNEILDECTAFSISRSSGSLYSITIALGDNSTFTYYHNQTKPYIGYDYTSYYKS